MRLTSTRRHHSTVPNPTRPLESKSQIFHNKTFLRFHFIDILRWAIAGAKHRRQKFHAVQCSGSASVWQSLSRSDKPNFGAIAALWWPRVLWSALPGANRWLTAFRAVFQKKLSLRFSIFNLVSGGTEPKRVQHNNHLCTPTRINLNELSTRERRNY